MESKNGKIIAAVFAVFVAVCIIFTSVVIYNTPVEITAVTAGNYSANLMNGGNVLGSGAYLFYTVPDEEGVYRIVGKDGTDKVKVADSGDGYLQVVGNTVYYCDDNKLMAMDWGGENKKTVLEYAVKPLVVGGSIYYQDQDGELCRYSFQKEQSTKLNVKPSGQFAFLSGRIYYIGEGGKVFSCDADGENQKIFVDMKAQKFALDGKFLFFINDGWLYCTMGGTADNCLKITKATDFSIYGGNVMYNYNGKLYYGILSALADVINDNGNEDYKPDELEQYEAVTFGAAENIFYYFDAEGALHRFDVETGEKLKFKK